MRTRRRRRPFGFSGLPVKRLYHAATRPQLLGVARSVAAEARRMDWKPDLVHVHVAHPAGAAAVAWAKRWGVPVVLTEHWTGYHDAKATPWWRRRAIKDALKGVDVVCPVTADLGASIAAWGTSAPMRVVPNVVDTDLFRPAEVQTLAGVPVGDARRKLEGAPLNRILHVSSMHDGQKNISGLLEALASICGQDASVRATLVGGEKAGLDTYQAWIDDRGLADRIQLTGPLDGDGVVKAMQSHDVLVLNSRSENFPCVIAEAWACGIPVMSTDVGGIHEHLPHGLSDRGFLFLRKRTPPRGPRPFIKSRTPPGTPTPSAPTPARISAWRPWPKPTTPSTASFCNHDLTSHLPVVVPDRRLDGRRHALGPRLHRLQHRRLSRRDVRRPRRHLPDGRRI